MSVTPFSVKDILIITIMTHCDVTQCTHSQGGNTALIMASKNDQLEVVKVLVTRGANINAKEYNVSDSGVVGDEQL